MAEDSRESQLILFWETPQQNTHFLKRTAQWRPFLNSTLHTLMHQYSAQIKVTITAAVTQLTMTVAQPTVAVS